MRSARARRWTLSLASSVFAVMVSFLVGINTANENEVIDLAQAEEFVSIVLTLQYTPRDGGKPRPFVFSNTSGSKPVKLQEIHDASILPERAADGCQKTSSTGRCTIANVPVGGEGGEGEKQYDIFLADASFFETLTDIPFETPLPFMRFNTKKCTGNVFTDENPAEREKGWCLSRQKDGSPYPEYFITLTLSERDVCRESPPPAASCTSDGKIITYECDPTFRGATSPWKPGTPQLCSEFADCPDGNSVRFACGNIGEAVCSQAAACTAHQLCEVHGFPTPPPLLAGSDTLVFSGKNFGNAGGTVSFKRDSNNEREVVSLPPGLSWTDRSIRLTVPYVAGEGKLEVRPAGHVGKALCESPMLFVLRPEDQPSIISAKIVSSGNRPVSPGFPTTIEVVASHPLGIDRLHVLDIELLEGSFPRVADVPLSRSVLARVQCDLRSQLPAVRTVAEGTFLCDIPVPQNLQSMGPFTYFVRISGGKDLPPPPPLADSGGGSLATSLGIAAVLPVAGSSTLAGDFDADGTLTVADAAIVSRIVRGVLTPTREHKLSDTDGDGTITRSDLITILHFLAQ